MRKPARAVAEVIPQWRIKLRQWLVVALEDYDEIKREDVPAIVDDILLISMRTEPRPFPPLPGARARMKGGKVVYRPTRGAGGDSARPPLTYQLVKASRAYLAQVAKIERTARIATEGAVKGVAARKEKAGQRRQAALRLAAAGTPTSVIAKRLGVSERSARRFLKK